MRRLSEDLKRALVESYESSDDDFDEDFDDDSDEDSDGEMVEAEFGAFSATFGAERSKELVFSSKQVARDFVKKVKGRVRGKFSVKKTKGWATYSVVFKPFSYADTVEMMKHYKPEKPVYKQIMADLNR